MLDYQNVSPENIGNVDFQIEEAEKRLALHTMNNQQLSREMELAQKRLAELRQQKTRIEETVMYQQMMKAGKEREVAEKKTAEAITAACKIVEEIIKDIGDAIKDNLHSKSKKGPVKEPVHER